MASPTIEVDYSKSQIREFYHDKTIFITGGSGFLGRLLVEKLLRTSNIKRVYILLRKKKEKAPEERFKDLFDIPPFEILKSSQPDFLAKISIMNGDLGSPSLGLSETSKNIIKDEVNCIFHVGATVRFDENLRKATHINARATRDLLRLAKDIKNLESYVHISTAYSNCTRKDIDEVFYDPLIKGDKLLDLVDSLDDKILDNITPKLILDNPNTYVFTKAIAEDLIREEAGNLPVAIVRPSIVISTYREPLPGWLDNLYGPTSLLVGVALGLLRTLYGNGRNVADLVPADFVINSFIAAGWDAGQRNTMKESIDDAGPKIFNYTSCAQNPITWNEYKDLAKESGLQVPSPLIVWHSTFDFHRNYYVHWMIALLTQTIPAYIVDFFAICCGKNPMFVKIFEKISKLCYAISYFICQEWKFTNNNVQDLYNKMNDTDKELYNFDMSGMTWRDFFSTYLLGARIYLLKDPIETIPKGRRKLLCVKVGHYIVCTVIILIFLKILITVWHFI